MVPGEDEESQKEFSDEISMPSQSSRVETDEDGNVCHHRFCTLDGCHRIPEIGYACIPGVKHACCKGCFRYHGNMPEGGYRPWKPVPHDSLCDEANPKSAEWDVKKRKTEEAYLGRKGNKEVPEVFK